MMPSLSKSQPPQSIDHWQDTMVNIVYNVCSIITIPVEMLLRPRYGTRYFSPIILFFSCGMMIVLPFFSAVAEGISRFIPFAGFRGPVGLFGIGAISKLFFLGCMVHGFRTWRLMVHPEREEVSTFEGPPLPIFRLIPGSFWMVRIIYEPVFVFVLSIVLPNFFILEPSGAHYLMLAAIMLTMKQYTAWYMQWQFLRGAMDMRNLGPTIAKVVDNTASEDELAKIHLASLPKDIPEDLRRDTAEHIARAWKDKP
jgi:hypothetical protein